MMATTPRPRSRDVPRGTSGFPGVRSYPLRRATASLLTLLLLVGVVGVPVSAVADGLDRDGGELASGTEESDDADPAPTDDAASGGEEAQPSDDGEVTPADDGESAEPLEESDDADPTPTEHGAGDSQEAEPSDDGEVTPLDDGGDIVPLNDAQLELNSKNVSPSSSEDDPLRPGDEVDYTLNYSCSDLGQGGNCNDAVIEDRLPTIDDVNGDLIQLEFVEVNTLTPSHWAFQGESGDAPDRMISWEGNDLDAGDSGALIITMRIPDGVVPALPEAQSFTNTATGTLPGQEDVSVTSEPSFVNALPADSTISKSGPGNALLNLAGTDPVEYTISICPEEGTALWDRYTVTDTLPVGATVVTDPLPFDGGLNDPQDPDVDGDTITWELDREDGPWPTPNAQGCLEWTFDVEYVNALSGGHESNEIGAEKTNTVKAEGSDGTDSQQIGPVDTTLTLTGPVTRFGPSKNARNEDGSRSTFYVQDDETVVYRLGASNTSDDEAEPFSTATLTDGPLPEEFTLTEIRTGSWTGAVDDVEAVIEVSTEASPDAPGDWTEVSTTTEDTVDTDLENVRWVRWVFTSTGDPAIGPEWSTSDLELVGTVGGDTADGSIELDNCVALTGEQGGITQDRGSNCAPLLLEEPQPHPDIDKTSPSTLEPGDTITYTLTVGNDVDATGDLESGFIVTDCVPDADHLVVSNVVTGSDWSYAASPFGTCTPDDGPENNGEEGTELVFTYNGDDLSPGDDAPAITYDVTANSFTVPESGSDPAPPGVRRNVAVVTPDDSSTFEHCVQDDCEVTRDVTVPFLAELESQKLVRGTLDSDFNIAGTTTPGGQVTWKLQVENRGNIDVENVQYIDVFPHVGDTGVRLLNSPRGSEYAPQLVSPIDAPGWQVEYSQSDNPCRDEVLAPGDTPQTGCEDPQWTDTPDLLDLPSYRSIRLTLGDRLDFGETATFEWDMITPLVDPAYEDEGEPFGRLQDCTIPNSDPPYPANPGASTLDREESADPTCPVANNSFAYGVDVPEDQLGGLPDPGRLGAEPPQVALHVASETTDNAIGDRVWFDDNFDGIQDDDESGVPGIRVELLDANDPDDLQPIATTFTDDDGKYLFDNLPDGDYVVRFYLPDDTAYIAPQWQDDTSIDGDEGSQGNSNLDSDVPQDPSGSTDRGNYFDTPVVELGNEEDLDDDGREIDRTWDAGIWVPDPSIEIDKVTKDAAWPDTDADDGVEIVENRPVEWIYTIANTGNTYLTGVNLTDVVTTPSEGVDEPDDIACDWDNATDPSTPAEVLAPDEEVECRASGVAIADDYENDATVTGTPAQFPSEEDGETVYEDIDKDGVPDTVSDDDPSGYVGLTVDIDLDKQTAGRSYDVTTGQLQDAGPGDGIEVTAGLGVTWIFDIENTGTAPLGAITLTDVGGTPDDPTDEITVTVDAGSLTVDGIAADQVTITGDERDDGILRPDETWTIEIQGVAVAGDYANDAEVEAEAVDEDGDPLTPPDDPNGQASDDDPSSYEGIPDPAISLEKLTNGEDADDSDDAVRVAAGEEVVWTFEVTNPGPVPLLDVEVRDPRLAPEPTDDEPVDDLVCSFELLRPFETLTCEVDGTRLGTGLQRNDATVSGQPAERTGGEPPASPTDDPTNWPEDADDYTAIDDAAPVTDDDPSHHVGTVPPAPGEANLSITKSHEGPVRIGDALTFTVEVLNAGPSSARGVEVVDVLPDGLTPIDADGEGWTCALDGQEVTCDLARWLGVDAVASPITIEVEVGAAAYPSTVNAVEVTSSTPDSDTDDNTATDTVEVPPLVDLAIDKSHSGDLVVGEQGTFTLTVTNLGPTPDPGPITIVDELPDGLEPVSASGDGWSCDLDGALVTCELPDGLEVDATSTVTLEVEVLGEAAPEVVNEATVSTEAEDTDPSNDRDDASVEVTPVWNLTAGKEAVAEEDGWLTWEITIGNDGPNATDHPIVVVDELVDELSFVSASGDGWDCDADGQVVTCTYESSLEAGQDTTLSLVTDLDDDVSGTIENVASASSGEVSVDDNAAFEIPEPGLGPDPDPGPDPASPPTEGEAITGVLASTGVPLLWLLLAAAAAASAGAALLRYARRR